MKRYFALFTCCFLMILSTAASRAASGPVVQNPSFEADAVPAYPGYTIAITSWTAVKPDGQANTGINDINGPFNGSPIPDGTRVAFLQNLGKLTQNVPGFVAGKKYLLSYFENARSGNTPTGRISLGGTVVVPEHTVAFSGAGVPDYFKAFVINSPGDGAFDLALEQTLGGGDNTIVYDMINIAEVGGPAHMMTSDSNLDFPKVAVNQSSDQILTVYNNGGSTLTISALALSGVSAAKYSILAPANGTLAVAMGTTQTISLRFKPTASGPTTATLEITSNDPIAPKTNVILTGSGVGNLVEVANGSFEVDANPTSPGYTSKISGWQVSGGVGFMNHADYPTFHDNGITPDGKNVAFIQGNGSFTQTVPAFVMGKRYHISIWVNQRTGCATPAQFQCKLGSMTMLNSSTPIAVASVEKAASFAVPFIHLEEDFISPITGSMALVIANFNPVGDNTLLLDNVSITNVVDAVNNWTMFE